MQNQRLFSEAGSRSITILVLESILRLCGYGGHLPDVDFASRVAFIEYKKIMHGADQGNAHVIHGWSRLVDPKRSVRLKGRGCMESCSGRRSQGSSQVSIATWLLEYGPCKLLTPHWLQKNKISTLCALGYFTSTGKWIAWFERNMCMKKRGRRWLNGITMWFRIRCYFWFFVITKRA